MVTPFPSFLTAAYADLAARYRRELEITWTLWRDVIDSEPEAEILPHMRDIGVASLKDITPGKLPKYEGATDEDRAYYAAAKRPDYAGELEYYCKLINTYRL